MQEQIHTALFVICNPFDANWNSFGQVFKKSFQCIFIFNVCQCATMLFRKRYLVLKHEFLKILKISNVFFFLNPIKAHYLKRQNRFLIVQRTAPLKKIFFCKNLRCDLSWSPHTEVFVVMVVSGFYIDLCYFNK